MTCPAFQAGFFYHKTITKTIESMIHQLKINFEIPVSPQLRIPRFVNIFIIQEKEIHLIDTGVKDGFKQIQEYINSIGRNISDIKTILLTHSHPDHIGCARLLYENSGCRIIAPKAETSWIENTELQFQKRPVPGFAQLVAGPVKVDQMVSGFQNIYPESGLNIQAIPVPGHSAGSTAYYLKNEKVLFSGDAILLPGEIPIFENVNDYLYSLETIGNLDIEVLYSAWDTPRNKAEIKSLLGKSKNYIIHIKETANKVAPTYKGDFSLEFCRGVLKQLGQNESLANPLLLKSFIACLS